MLARDALRATAAGFELSVSLPWIRSLPLAGVAQLVVSIDGEPTDVRVALGDRRVGPAELSSESGWWFIQDRLRLVGERMLSPGVHDVSVSFSLVIPYLQVGPSGPLTLPFAALASLDTDAAASVSPQSPLRNRTNAPISDSAPAAVRIRANDPISAQSRIPWTLGASAFNWTPEVIRAERPAPDIAVGIVTSGVASVIELEPGQLWRSYPESTDAEVDALRSGLDAAGGAVSIVGGSLDDWLPSGKPRSEDERLEFLLPQLHAAHRVGAHGVRLPIGQAGEPLLRRLLPALHDLDLVLYEEIQGQQTPDSPGTSPSIDTISAIDDERVRLLVDISMLMPALPPTYLERLRAGGLDGALLDRLTSDWREPATHGAVVDHLRSGAVPPAVHTMYMNLLIRFGRSDAAALREILPLVGAFHLKFWDLDDADGRVSAPIRDLGVELERSGFSGPLTSEWGGHEWLDSDPAGMTARHLELARAALGAGALQAARVPE
jgi:hypothetical protein